MYQNFLGYVVSLQHTCVPFPPSNPVLFRVFTVCIPTVLVYSLASLRALYLTFVNSQT